MAGSLPESSGEDGGEPFDLKYMAFMLQLLRTLTAAAFSTTNPDAFEGAELARRLSETGNEAKEKGDAKGAGEASSFKELQSLCVGPIGREILESIDYELLQGKCLSITHQALAKPKMIFEDRLVVEYALSLWAGCLLQRADLFEKFTKLEGEVKADEFLLTGLLFCPYESVREEFKATCAVLCSRGQEGASVDPLAFILKVLTSNFSLISKYPCK